MVVRWNLDGGEPVTIEKLRLKHRLAWNSICNHSRLMYGPEREFGKCLVARFGPVMRAHSGEWPFRSGSQSAKSAASLPHLTAQENLCDNCAHRNFDASSSA